MDSSLLLPILIAGGVVLLGVALASSNNEAMDKRVKTVSREKESAVKRKTGDPDADRKKKMLGGIKDLEMRERQMRKARLSISARIEQAGLTVPEQTFWIASAAFAIVALLVVMVVFGQPFYYGFAAAGVAGFGLPRWILGFLVGGRQKKFTSEFANAIDVIVRGVKSGLPLNECLKIIAREAPEPLSSEFQRLCDSTSMGVPLDQGLTKMFERMPLPEVSFFSIVLAIQLKAGGNLSEALNNLSVVLRSRKLMREKINALSSEAKASAAIIGALPICVCGIVYVTSPSYMGLLFSDPTGHMGLLAGTTMMTLGILVMRQMINFDI
jgi:tight adherence protein B